MHNIWVREHNYVADLINREHPGLSDEEIFHKARLAITVVNAKVHTVEWTPAILNNKALRVGMNTNWYGVSKNPVLHKIERFLLPGNPLSLTGEMGYKQRNDGVPFALTEEFSTVYRMHSLVPDVLHIRDHKTGKLLEERNLEKAVFSYHRELVEKHKGPNLYYSFGMQPPTGLLLNNFPGFLRRLQKTPGTEDAFIDLATRDIVRERERGVPRYNAVRRQFSLKPAKDFSDITQDPQVAERLARFYKNVDEVDFKIGCLAEDPRPENFVFGETAFNIFILMASRRLKSDRFFNEYYNEKYYTKAGYDYTVETGMKAIISRHYPELVPHFKHLDNVFFAWK